MKSKSKIEARARELERAGNSAFDQFRRQTRAGVAGLYLRKAIARQAAACELWGALNDVRRHEDGRQRLAVYERAADDFHGVGL